MESRGQLLKIAAGPAAAPLPVAAEAHSPVKP